MTQPANPLLKHSLLPPFSQIKTEHIEAAIDQKLAENRHSIAQLLKNLEAPDWQNLQIPLEQWSDELDQIWSTVSHLNAVMNTASLREAYSACLPKLTEYASEIGQNEQLFEAYTALANSDAYQSLAQAQKKVISNQLRDFKLSGIALNKTDRKRFNDITLRLSELATHFSNNVLDATQGWHKQVLDVEELAGIPDTVLESYRQAAQQKNLPGYVVTLDLPAYLPLMQYCENSALRKELYLAFTTRASDQGPNAGQWDNSALMEEILALRHELVTLLRFSHFAEYSLATKMAERPEQVKSFLYDLAEKTLPMAKQEYEELKAFARSQQPAEHDGSELNAWDIPFYSEQLRLHKYALSQEELRAYFPADKVIAGLFAVVQRLFGIDIIEQEAVETWHRDVRFYHVERNGELIAKCYLDIFARENKRGGAWMACCRHRRVTQTGSLQLPVAYLTCNFTPPTDDLPSLLTHQEVTTLFHEFGHGLHHMLTTVETSPVSGINGVAWDAVELPSQFLENWCWQKEAIPLISEHYQTGQPLPDELLQKMLAAKHFQAGMQMMRQLEFALFDFDLHMNYSPDRPEDIQRVLDDIRAKVAVYPVPAFNRFQHSFSHIFSGGYAAGYYSYKWAEVLSADAFSRFEEDGIFNKQTGQDFYDAILSQGGSREAMDLFIAFRGREPQVDALLRQTGVLDNNRSQGVVDDGE